MKKNHTYIRSFSRLMLIGLLGMALGRPVNVTAQTATAKDTTTIVKGKAKVVKGKSTVAKDTPTTVNDTTTALVVKKKSYTKNTFDGNLIIDNQSVMVPIKGTFEFEIQHRFGTTVNGFSDLFGIFAGANIRLGFSYTPVKDLQIGFGTTNENMEVEWNLKYALLKQTKDNSMPVSVTYYGNFLLNTRKKDATTLFVKYSDRFAYFNQLIIARKFTEGFSVQGSFDYTHFNNLEGYLDASGNVMPKWKNDHFAFSLSGKYKITDGMALIADYNQPITQHPLDNPKPNLALGIEMKTSGHDFQVFLGNYSSLEPENNALFNQNNFRSRQFLIGFNISRLWNF